MVKDGVTVNKVVEYTGIDVDVVKKLQNQLNKQN